MRDEIKALCANRGDAFRAAELAGVSYRTFYTAATAPEKVSKKSLDKVTLGLIKLRAELQGKSAQRSQQLQLAAQNQPAHEPCG